MMHYLEIEGNAKLGGEVAISGAKNAALLALRILGASDDTLRDRLAAYQSEMRETVLAKAEALKNEYPCDY